MRTAAEGAMAPDKFRPLDSGEWRGLMTDAEREALAVMLEDARQAGYWQGYHARTVECVRDHATIQNRIDAASRAFLLMDAEEAHRKAVAK